MGLHDVVPYLSFTPDLEKRECDGVRDVPPL